MITSPPDFHAFSTLNLGKTLVISRPPGPPAFFRIRPPVPKRGIMSNIASSRSSRSLPDDATYVLPTPVGGEDGGWKRIGAEKVGGSHVCPAAGMRGRRLPAACPLRREALRSPRETEPARRHHARAYPRPN